MNILDRVYYSKPYRAVADWRISAKNVKFVKGYVTTHISPEQRKQVLDFYKPYTRINTIFHDYYTEKNGRFDVRYVPDDLYFCKIDKYYNNWHDAPILENKCFFRDMFSGIRQPEIFAYRMDRYWFTGDRRPIRFADLISEVKKEKELVVKKAAESAGGRGVSFVCAIEDMPIEESFTHSISRLSGDIIVQYPIQQHEVLNQVNHTSVNTIRILSLLRENDVKIYSMVLRMGSSSSRTDNVSSGGFSCGINGDGRLNEIAKSKKGNSTTVCPDSGVKLNEIVVPGIEKAKELVYESAWRVPRFRLASWDIAIERDGMPVLVEANLSYGGVWVHQMNNGPVFGEDTEMILREVFKQ